MSSGFSKKHVPLISAALLVMVALIYGQVAQFDFINFDDPDYVINNPHVTGGLNSENITWAMTTGAEANWHPSTWLSLMTDATLFGPAPRGFHVVNAVFHGLNSLLVFFLLFYLTGATWRSAAVAALFALHPMHVESVAWITERKDVLSLFWGLLSLLAYQRYAQKGGRLPYILTGVFLAIGLMAKSLLVTLPFVYLLLDYWPLQKWSAGAQSASSQLKKLIIEKVPFLVLVILSSVATVIAQGRYGAITNEVILSPFTRMTNALVAYAQYLIKLIWPQNMAYLYPHPQMPGGTPWAAWQIGASVAALLFISYLVYRLRHHRFLTFGWLWFLGTMVPMIGLVQVGTQSMADRYTYLPYLGLYIILVWGAGHFVQSGPISKSGKKAPLNTNLAWVIAIIVFGILGSLTFGQLKVWRNSIALGEHAVAVSASGPKVNFNLATALSKAGRYDEAITYYQATVKMRPDHAKAFNNMGRTLNKLGRKDEALVSFDQAIAQDHNFTLAFINKSNTLAEMGNIKEAITTRSIAVELDPENYESRLILGQLLGMDGQLDAAITQFNRILISTPNHPEAKKNLALAHQIKAKAAAGQ